MRSWSIPDSAIALAASPWSPPVCAIVHAVPRSMRATHSRAQWRAMSVALLDHAEIVPGRGVTTTAASSAAAARSFGTNDASSSSSSRPTIRSEVSPVRAK